MQGEPEVYLLSLQFLLRIAVICDTVENELCPVFVFNGPILWIFVGAARRTRSNSTPGTVELYGMVGGTTCTLIDLPYHTSTSTVVLV